MILKKISGLQLSCEKKLSQMWPEYVPKWPLHVLEIENSLSCVTDQIDSVLKTSEFYLTWKDS